MRLGDNSFLQFQLSILKSPTWFETDLRADPFIRPAEHLPYHTRRRLSGQGRGQVDELRLIVYPLFAGQGKALFATTERRRGLELREVQQLQGEHVSLMYGIG